MLPISTNLHSRLDDEQVPFDIMTDSVIDLVKSNIRVTGGKM